jgi:hypothetical protein
MPQFVMEVQQAAAIAAVEKATEMTPPSMAAASPNATGELKAAWALDSVVKPKRRAGNSYCILANNMNYSSYVNDGHVMDKHFVPGLIINPYTGTLVNMGNADAGGIMVGTKTKFVEGIFMVEAARKVYSEKLHAGLPGKLQKLLDEG